MWGTPLDTSFQSDIEPLITTHPSWQSSYSFLSKLLKLCSFYTTSPLYQKMYRGPSINGTLTLNLPGQGLAMFSCGGLEWLSWGWRWVASKTRLVSPLLPAAQLQLKGEKAPFHWRPCHGQKPQAPNYGTAQALPRMPLAPQARSKGIMGWSWPVGCGLQTPVLSSIILCYKPKMHQHHLQMYILALNSDLPEPGKQGAMSLCRLQRTMPLLLWLTFTFHVM